jgi:hypothetical protein
MDLVMSISFFELPVLYSITLSDENVQVESFHQFMGLSYESLQNKQQTLLGMSAAARESIYCHKVQYY